MLPVGLQGGIAVAYLGNHLHVRLDIQRRREAHPDHEVVIHHQNAY
jgi:hypothetical protein